MAEWDLAVQLFTQAEADAFPFDHLDATKLIPTDEMNEMSLSSIEASIAAINASIKKANNSN